MPRGFTEHEKEFIRQRLLEQGYKLFSVYGLKKTTVEELATAAGISKGAFYLFYASKEGLFMDVVEEKVEKRFRQEILAIIDQPGDSPRDRLATLLKKAFTLFRTVPMLQFIMGGDSDLLLRRVPAETLQQHVTNDLVFIDELVAHCQEAGIPIQIRAEEMSGLLYALVLGVIHENDLGPNSFGGAIDVLLELIAAYCLGEIELQAQNPFSPMSQLEEGFRP